MHEIDMVLQPLPAPITHDEKILNALGSLKATSTKLVTLRDSLARLSKTDITQLPDTRMLKVHTHLRTNGRKPTIYSPEIVLRGNWLERVGFTYDDQWVYVISMDEMLIITPESKSARRQRLREGS